MVSLWFAIVFFKSISCSLGQQRDRRKVDSCRHTRIPLHIEKEEFALGKYFDFLF